MEGLEAEGQAEIERVLEEFGREAWGNDGLGSWEAVGRGGKDGDGGRVVKRIDEGEPVARRADMGEVVAREDVDDGVPVMRNGADDDVSNDETNSNAQKRSRPVNQSEDDEPKVIRQPSPSPPAKVAKSKSASTKKRTIETETRSKPTKKKRKKGGDAIDDLFSGW